MNCLVTGGAGFIGSHLVEALMEAGHKVRVLDDLSSGSEANIEKFAKDVRFYPKNVCYPDLDDMFQGVDVVFHLAAKSTGTVSQMNDVNVYGTLNILEHCKKHKIKRLVYSSCSSVYGEPPTRVLQGAIGLRENDPEKPDTEFGLQKFIGEQYCKLYSNIHGMEIVALRCFNVYGERQTDNVFTAFAEQKKNDKSLRIFGKGKQKRDYVYVGDVVSANILAAESDFKGYYVFNVGAGDNRSVNDIAKLFGGKTKFASGNVGPNSVKADISRIRSALNWEPKVTVEEWLEESNLE